MCSYLISYSPKPKPGASCAAQSATFQTPPALQNTSDQAAEGMFRTVEAQNEPVRQNSPPVQLALPAPSPPEGPCNSDILEVVAPVEEVAEKQTVAPASSKCVPEAKEKVQTGEQMRATEASELLEQSLHERDQDKKEKKQGRGLKRPAAAKAASSKPASRKPNAGGGASKPPVLKRPAGKKKKQVKQDMGPIPSTKDRLKMAPFGCSKCRGTAGCTPSCWVGCGYHRV